MTKKTNAPGRKINKKSTSIITGGSKVTKKNKKNTCIIAAGHKFDIGRRVVLWDEEGGFNAYEENRVTRKTTDRRTGKNFTKVIQGKRYTPRNVDLDKLRKQVINFTLHHSVTYRASHCFNALHNYRKLSVNFIIDDDKNATIYQCLDIKDYGWSQGPCNKTGPGVEICWMPQYWETPGLYSEPNRKKYKVQEHEIGTDRVHGSKFKIFKPTEAQVESTIALIWGFSELFPDVNPQFPNDKHGNISKTVISKPEKFNGLLNHYQITRRKIDPLGLDLEYIESEVALRRLLGY